MTGPVALRAASVSLSFGEAAILDGVDLEVRHGEVVALVGPNGAGKSTLLSLLSGDVDPDEGTVELNGVPIAGQHASALARQRAVLLQRHNLAFGFRAREVVEMGRSVWRRTERAERDDEVVDWAMEVADVTHLTSRVVPTLSGGEQARVSFARLLAQDVEVHLLDEPTAALDIKHQESVLEQARGSAARGAAVVVVLHDLSLAAAYADRICVLAKGRVRACGTPSEVLTSDLLSSVYEHPVEVFNHAGHLLVVPVRARESKESSCPVVR
ncbi:heme ABC transporter ATP-binding protein [Nocardioides jishulii]|uniref:Heme ABC transporter ATP-binding protein n=1 Tax=Nocardioides jishulii TaxID=2575440 RepID=A0A4U2YK98_9ACTN|nr:heme ABC transporter ATP-binding protein [Nocardioides jishulii]QCX28271.1 heme ABC transporter ATP-binding protein [Nocardioides jishulii]TKI60935.1 heme ABC transporter ATP-binding protein [Nocardioides jishulii]